ncbi:MAG: isoleucine--tRNA ligase [Bacteroidota bacterium]
MDHYPFYDKINLAKVAKEILLFWEKKKVFQTALKKNEKSLLHFYEGPPGANGRPGLHHLLSRTLKDLFCRYKTMQGYCIPRKAGWDAHGLPVELEVEKELGITKEDIGKKISIAEYNQACQRNVMLYKEEWEQITKRIGYWLEMKNPYITSTANYISVLWGIIKKLDQKGLLYKGYSIQPYSPAAGTGLSSHELNQPGCYKEVKDISIVAKFKVQHLSNTYLLAWTTTPWTLPANTALAVSSQIIYACVSTFNPYTLQTCQVILAKSSLSRYFNGQQTEEIPKTIRKEDPIPWKIVAEYKGKDLVGWSYEQLMPYIRPSKPFFKVVIGDFVTDKEGTGIVHIAPTFGNDDFMLAQKNNIPAIATINEYSEPVPIVTKQGKFVEAITDFAHLPVKADYEEKKVREQKDYQSVDLQIAIKLKKENKAFAVNSYWHSYPHCWRTDKPIIYYPLQAWFIKTTACKHRLIELNRTIDWQPPSTGIGRFEDWLKNLVDWNLTRSRFWGTPLPIWVTEDGKEKKCIGSISELAIEVKKAIKIGVMPTSYTIKKDLHRPYVDDIILVSDRGKKMYREQEVIDVWFDSGAMPYAQHSESDLLSSHPPADFPAFFIIEGIDQTRGWFFTLHVLAVLLYDQVAFKKVLATGLVLDKKGVKMSKRLGNALDPHLLLDEYGPDVIRWYMISNANPWDDLKFDPSLLLEIRRKFFGTLFHTYQFFALYANLDKFNAEDNPPSLQFASELDAWILSRLHYIIQYVQYSLDKFSPTKASRALSHFVIDDLSNWYVRLNRKRFWRGGHDKDKEVAYQTLYYCLKTIAQLAAPIAPFYMDKLFQDLNQNDQSVHLSEFPELPTIYRNEALEAKMETARTIASLSHSLRKKHNIKVRIPLKKLLIPPISPQQKSDIKHVMSIILAETNVKEIVFVSNTTGIIKKMIKPNFNRLGKQYRHHLQDIQKLLALLTQEEITSFEESGNYTLTLSDQRRILLTLKDVTVKTQDMPGWAIASDSDITIALDLNLTDDLIIEGIARELVNKIQNLRKEQQLEVQDKVILTLATTSARIKEAIQKHQLYITTETQALELNVVSELKYVSNFTIENEEINVSLIKK